MAQTKSALTSWSASYEDVSGTTVDLDPNELGFDDGPPDEVLAQWTAAAQAAQLLAKSKTLGGDNLFHVELSGSASAGHADEDTISVSVSRSQTALPEAEPLPAASAEPTVVEATA